MEFTADGHVPVPMTEAEALALIDQGAAAEFVSNVDEAGPETTAAKAAMYALELAFSNPERAKRLLNGLVGSMELAHHLLDPDEPENIRRALAERMEDFVHHWERHESHGVMEEGQKAAKRLNEGIDNAKQMREQMKSVLSNLPAALANGTARFAVEGPDGTLRPLGGPRTPGVIELPASKPAEEKKERPN